MNFYKRHIGDYIKDAAHLTLLEHGVYVRLMDVYYSRESAIPEAQAARLIGARSKDELQALTNVLNEFFTLEDGAWKQKRCEAEIEAANAQAEANRNNGKRGGRPKRNATDEKPIGFSMGSDSESEKNLSQTPDTISHKPEEKKKPRVTALSSSDLVADGLTEEAANEWLAFRRQKRAPLTATAWEGIRREAAKAGWSVQDAVSKAMARGWTGFEASWVANDARASPARPTRLDQQAQILNELTGRDRIHDPDDPFTIETPARRVG